MLGKLRKAGLPVHIMYFRGVFATVQSVFGSNTLENFQESLKMPLKPSNSLHFRLQLREKSVVRTMILAAFTLVMNLYHHKILND